MAASKMPSRVTTAATLLLGLVLAAVPAAAWRWPFPFFKTEPQAPHRRSLIVGGEVADPSAVNWLVSLYEVTDMLQAAMESADIIPPGTPPAEWAGFMEQYDPVALRDFFREQFVEASVTPSCGGSLVADNVVLTAAHCLADSNDICRPNQNWIVRTGAMYANSDSGEGDFRLVTSYACHPGYSSRYLPGLGNQTFDMAALTPEEQDQVMGMYAMINDIAVMQLAAPFGPELANVVPLATEDEFLAQANHENGTMLVLGFGDTEEGLQQGSRVLMWNELMLLNSEVCAALSPSTMLDWFSQVNTLGIDPVMDDALLCAGGLMTGDTCQGDSGGPTYILGDDGETVKQVGIVSWGRGCNRETPGYYVKLFNYMEFVDAWVQEWSMEDISVSGR